MLLVLRFTADDAVAMAADYVCEESLTRSSVVSKFHDSLNDREANSETALDPRDRHQTMSIPHPSAFISKGPFLRQLLSLLHPAIDSLWNACRVASKVQPATDGAVPCHMARLYLWSWMPPAFRFSRQDAVLRTSGRLRSLWYESASIRRLDPSPLSQRNSGTCGLCHVRAATLHSRSRRLVCQHTT
jgi:hypothetical protein